MYEYAYMYECASKPPRTPFGNLGSSILRREEICTGMYQHIDSFLDESSGMASGQPSGAAAAPPPANNQAEQDHEQEQPGREEYSAGGDWNQEEQ